MREAKGCRRPAKADGRATLSIRGDPTMTCGGVASARCVGGVNVPGKDDLG